MAQDNIYARMRNAVKGVPAGNTYALLNDDGTIGGLGPFKKLYIDAVNGVDTNAGKSPANAVKTLDALYALLTAGKNDTGVVIGDGSTTQSVRLSAAFNFNKNATNLVGIASQSLFSPRARITTVAAAAAVPLFFTVSSDGSSFENIDFYHGYTSDGAGQICMSVAGNRNVFSRCHFGGITKLDDANARVLKITGQENLFEDCVIGLDTVIRTNVASASIEFASGAARNVFRRCIFPMNTAGANVLHIYGAAASCIDKMNIFEDCTFYNVGSATQTALATLPASAGGVLLFKNCFIGPKITGYGTDANTRGQVWTIAPVATTTTSSVIAVAPAA